MTRGGVILGLAAGVTAAVLVAPGVPLTAFTGNHGPGSVPSPAGERPVKPNRALNVLLVGTDVRQGPAPSLGGGPTVRTDTILLVHLSADRKTVGVVSIPRDSMVRVPACPIPAGTTVPARTGMINSAFATGGLTCVRKTVESLRPRRSKPTSHST